MKKTVRIKHANDEYVGPRIYDKTPQEMFRPRVASNCEVNRTHVFRVKRRTVAIVVVPGVMASRLSNLEGKPAWDPDDLGFMWDAYFWCAPEKRYDLLIKNGRQVMNRGNPEISKKYPKAEERGWTGLAWDYFGKLLGGLHDWKTPLKVFLDLPVYAFGYDWVDSCEASGTLLQQFILEKVKADKVIIVSHSMGGLVTRHALAGEGGEALAEKVLGVVHGAQPVHGAPDAYHRTIAGTGAEGILGRIASEVLGPDGPHMTAIIPHAPGVLQLLPNQFYRTNKGEKAWLHIQDLDDPEKFTSYPKNDPYEEIYAKSHHKEYWGFIHGEWFQPHAEDGATIEAAFRGENTGDIGGDDPSIAGQLGMHISKAKEVHNLIGPYSHQRTIQLFSNGKHETITEVCWLARDITQHVLDARVETYSREDKPLRHLWELNCVPDFNRFGQYGEVRWRDAGGALSDVVPGNALLIDLQKRIREQGLRLYLLRMTASGEKVHGLTDDPLRHQGDGTVPLSSATGMNPDMNEWGGCTHLLPVWFGPNNECKVCTGQVNQEAHASFFVDRKGEALNVVKRAIHNLCLGWLKGEFT